MSYNNVESVKYPLTQSALLNLLGGESEHGEQLNQDFHNNIRHQRSKWDRSVDLKAFQEISEAFKQINERIVARVDVNGCLMCQIIRKTKTKNRTGYVL